MQWALDATTPYPWFQSRGLKDFAGWVRFFEEWRSVAEELFRDWPGLKMKIPNAHADWPEAYRQMRTFLEIEER